MSESSAVADLGLERLVRLEGRIGSAEGEGLRARWEFGHELLAARDGKGRLPNGFLKAVAERTKASRPELGHRMRFAERFPTVQELANAVSTFRSWHQVVAVGLAPIGDEGPPEAGPVPDGTYQVIVADPPWAYENRATRGAAEDHYGTLSIAQLVGADLLPDGKNLAEAVLARTAPQAHLYLWTTNGFLREAFELVDAWGFTYKTCLTWVKPQIGMGNYFRSCTEHVLFGVKGGLRTQERDLRNWFEARRGKHSAKPDSFYDLVEKASPGPYLDLFSRRRRFGWDVWGDQA